MKKIIVANWKMNPASLAEARRLFDRIKKYAARIRGTEIVIAPPFVYLETLSRALGKKIAFAAQNVFWENSGPFTGEISPVMLRNLGVEYVIIGHSERRENFKETDAMVNKKIKAALNKGLKIILCVGEKERGPDILPEIVKDEILKGLKDIPKKFADNIIVAYEPIWAIGTGRTDNPEDLFKIVIYIKRTLFDLFGRNVAREVPILYGGSVDEKNVNNFLSVDGVAGLLVGGSSLDPQKFLDILKVAS